LLACAIEVDHARRLSVAVIKGRFREAGGRYEEYVAAVKYAIAHGWITIHPSGAYLRLHRRALISSRDAPMWR
jgi:hypothetical protein